MEVDPVVHFKWQTLLAAAVQMLYVCYRQQQLSAVFLIILSVHIDCCPKQH